MRISIRVGNEYVFTDNIQPIEPALINVRPIEEEKPVEETETFAEALADETQKVTGATASPEQMATTANGYESIAPPELAPIFQKASETYGLDQKLLELIGYHESGFKANAVSKSGAMGIMQLMPTTAESLGVTNPYDPEQSIMAGASLLKKYYDDYNGNLDLMLAAYSAGAGAVRKHGGVPPYAETTNYIKWIHERYP